LAYGGLHSFDQPGLAQGVSEKRDNCVSKVPQRLCCFFFFDVVLQAFQQVRNSPLIAALSQGNTGFNKVVVFESGKQRSNDTRKREPAQLPSRSVPNCFFSQTLHWTDGPQISVVQDTDQSVYRSLAANNAQTLGGSDAGLGKRRRRREEQSCQGLDGHSPVEENLPLDAKDFVQIVEPGHQSPHFTTGSLH
jgi:hypothetical protein